MSSEEDVTDDDNDSAGVELGVLPCALARASASETADKYEAAVFKAGEDIFLNIDGVGDAGFSAMGEGILLAWSSSSSGVRGTATSGVAEVQADSKGVEKAVGNEKYRACFLCKHSLSKRDDGRRFYRTRDSPLGRRYKSRQFRQTQNVLQARRW